MAKLKFKDENGDFIPMVQDVKVNGSSVFDGKDANITTSMLYTVASNHDIEALFNGYSVSVTSSSGGSATASSDKVQYGGSVVLYAKEDVGYHFSHWSDGEYSNPRLISNVNSDISLSAVFENGYGYMKLSSQEDNAEISGLLTDFAEISVELEYSLDNGNSWSIWKHSHDSENGNEVWSTITLNFGESALFRGENSVLGKFNSSKGRGYGFNFIINNAVRASGNVNTLLSYTQDLTSVPDYALCWLFQNCSGLISTPYMPSINLGAGCYCGMYYKCYNLVEVCDLPSNAIMSDSSCIGTWRECTSLVNAPKLPTSIAPKCYSVAFYGCTSLVSVTFPSTTLATQCYYGACRDCTSLSNVTVGALSWNTNDAAYYLTNVALSGTFTKPSSTEIPRGMNGIPDDWNIINI